MESACVSAEDDETVVRLGRSSGWVRLWNRTNPFKDDPYGKETVSFCVAIGAPDMRASLHGVMLVHEDPSVFVAELAESFTGWSGTKVWEMRDGDVRIEAAFRSLGHVDLTWTLAQRWLRDPWSASVTVQGVHAGEEMRKLAQDMRELLG